MGKFNFIWAIICAPSALHQTVILSEIQWLMNFTKFRKVFNDGWACTDILSFPGHPSGPSGSDPISMMEYYMKKAAEEEKLRPYKSSKDEMPPPASLQGLSLILFDSAISLF